MRIVLCQRVSMQGHGTSCRFILQLIFLDCLGVQVRKWGILTGIKIMLFKSYAGRFSCDTALLDMDRIGDVL